MIKILLASFVLFSALVPQLSFAGKSDKAIQMDYVQSQLHTKAKPKKVWLTKDVQREIYELIGRKYHSARIKYWEVDGKQVWVLNEIGKEKYITSGFTVKGGKILDTKVLVFRESRGWQIKSESFTAQFLDVFLNKKQRLSSSIDGISGATLSVRAMKKMAKLALFLNAHTLPQPVAVNTK